MMVDDRIFIFIWTVPLRMGTSWLIRQLLPCMSVSVIFR